MNDALRLTMLGAWYVGHSPRRLHSRPRVPYSLEPRRLTFTVSCLSGRASGNVNLPTWGPQSCQRWARRVRRDTDTSVTANRVNAPPCRVIGHYPFVSGISQWHIATVRDTANTISRRRGDGVMAGWAGAQATTAMSGSCVICDLAPTTHSRRRREPAHGRGGIPAVHVQAARSVRSARRVNGSVDAVWCGPTRCPLMRRSHEA